MSRCKACDTPMKEHEIIWVEEEHHHEDLCSRCRSIIAGYTVEDQETLDLLDKCIDYEVTVGELDGTGEEVVPTES